MSSTGKVGVVLLVMMSVGALAWAAERPYFEAPPPEEQSERAKPEVDALKTTPSRTTGALAVTVPLDDTGVADWRFVNPRNVQKVPAGAAIEFFNQTADRTFEVTTAVALPPAELPPGEIPATVPLLIYDALAIPREPIERPKRPPVAATETLDDFEERLMADATAGYPDFATILTHVLALEEALRDRAAKVAAEREARAALAGMKLEALGSAVQTARDALKDSVEDREEAEKAVQDLIGKPEDAQGLTGKPEDLAKRRKPLIDHLTARAVLKRQQRKEVSAAAARAEATTEKSDADTAAIEMKKRLTAEIALLEAAIAALKNQSDDTALLARLQRSIPGVRLDDCTVAATVSCTAAIQVYPNGSDVFPHEVLLFQADPSGPARFSVKFFEEDETPARPTAYLVAAQKADKVGAPKSVGTISAVASVGALVDPAVADLSAKSRTCPFLCPDRPLTGEHRDHYTGSGRVDVTQSFGNLLDGKVSFGFKEGDLGGANTTIDVKLAQYRFNIYTHPGWTFHYGRFNFATPTQGIAINETGDGLRIAFHNYALAHVVKRESGSGTADADDRDNEVVIFEATNMRVSGGMSWNPLRTLSVVSLTGKDRKEPEKKKHALTGIEETFVTAHEYWTYGGQLGFTLPKQFYGSLAAYRSGRNADEKGALCGNALHVCDGRGDVGLFTLTRPFRFGADGKSTGNLTLTLGMGSGDDPSTLTEDEGYVGETAGFAPDLIFLSTLAGGISSRDFVDLAVVTDPSEFHRLDVGALGIGRGLANKRYVGLKYVDNRFSLLELVAILLKIPKSDIRSRATFVTLNDYRLRRSPFDSSHDAGQELDVEFQVETPRAVKVTLKGGYYRPGAAVEKVIGKDVWTISSGISISL